MAQTWEWGPWAQQGEDFQTQQRKLDLEKQQADAAALRQRMADAAAMARTQASQEGALKNMLAGKAADQSYKIADEDRMAGNAVPFLRSVIQGNPAIGKAYGFGQEEQLPVPEAGYAGQGPVRTPSDQELRGIAKAAPTLANTLATQAIPKPPEPFTLGENQQRFSPTGEPIATGPQRPRMTEQQADQIIAENIQRNPSLQGRITKKMDDRGGWTVQTSTTEPLTESPNLWLSQALDPSTPIPQRIQAQMKYDQWKKDQAEIAGTKKAATEANTPLNEDARKRIEMSGLAIAAGYRLMQFNLKDIENMTGAGKIGYEAALHAQELSLPTPGYTPEDVARYNDFKKFNGMIEQFKFAVGGKQLTEGEQRVVEAYIPTGRERTTSEYQAKLRGIVAAMEASQEVDQYLYTTGKGFTDTAMVRSLFINALAKRGIDVTKPVKDQAESQMPSGARLRSKYGKP